MIRGFLGEKRHRQTKSAMNETACLGNQHSNLLKGSPILEPQVNNEAPAAVGGAGSHHAEIFTEASPCGPGREGKYLQTVLAWVAQEPRLVLRSNRLQVYW